MKSQTSIRINSRSIWLYLGLVIIGIVVGISFDSFKNKSNQVLGNSDLIREKDSRYQFINPLLACANSSQNIPEFKPLKDKLNSLISKDKSSGVASDIAVYFKDLNTGNWLGINEDHEFSPASLLKVNLMIAYYKLAESDPSLLSTRVKVSAKEDANAMETFKSPSNIVDGGIYTIDDLIKYMIINSDNNAMNVLRNLIDPKELNRVYTDLGIQVPKDIVTNSDFASAKAYSLTLRVLYNATYLSRTMSDKALGLMSQTTFKAGIAAGIPSDIKVADKFGERSLQNATTGQVSERELHDCGIVYHPTNPYLLCVMTKGNDLNALSKAISEISSVTYTQVNQK